MGGPGSGRKPTSAAELHRRGTFRRDRHEVGDGSARDGRPELHSLRGHRLAVSGLPMTLACALVHALRADQTLSWDDLPTLLARLRG